MISYGHVAFLCSPSGPNVWKYDLWVTCHPYFELLVTFDKL